MGNEEWLLCIFVEVVPACMTYTKSKETAFAMDLIKTRRPMEVGMLWQVAQARLNCVSFSDTEAMILSDSFHTAL